MRSNIEATVIFGVDSRQDYPDFDQREQRSADSVVAIISANFVDFGNLATKRLKTRFEEAGEILCPDEPFREQPTATGLVGTGFLVRPNIIATSSHFDSATLVSELAFVFGYRKNEAGIMVTSFSFNDIYRGVSVIDRGEGWALVRLDRNVVGHSVVRLRTEGTVSNDRRLYVIGHPLGLPLKRAKGEIITNNQGPFFETDLDAYEGNSGSPVFRTGAAPEGDTDLVEGILINGLGDFIPDEAGCFRSRRVLEAVPGQAETCVRVTEFAHLI